MNIQIGIDILVNGVETRIWSGNVYSDFDHSLIVTNLHDGHAIELEDSQAIVITVSPTGPNALPALPAPKTMPGWVGVLSLN